MAVPDILPRDVDPTGFTEILDGLVSDLPDALCATFMDGEGETIDLSTRIDPFEARVATAELAIALARARVAATELQQGPIEEFKIAGARRSVVVRRVSEGCDLMLLITGNASLALAARACRIAARALSDEAGVAARASRPHPRPRTAEGEAPAEVPASFLEDGLERPITTLVGVYGQQRMLLVRTNKGDEVVIVRDPATGRWYRL